MKINCYRLWLKNQMFPLHKVHLTCFPHHLLLELLVQIEGFLLGNKGQRFSVVLVLLLLLRIGPVSVWCSLSLMNVFWIIQWGKELSHNLKITSSERCQKSKVVLYKFQAHHLVQDAVSCMTTLKTRYLKSLYFDKLLRCLNLFSKVSSMV